MLPFLLHGQKHLGVTGRHRLFHVRERLPEFLAGMRYQRFEGALVRHRDSATLNSPAQQLSRQQPLPSVIETAIRLPASSLGLDVREQLGERFELDETVNGKSEHPAIFKNCRGRCNDCLQRNRFCPHRYSQSHRNESHPYYPQGFGGSFFREGMHVTPQLIERGKEGFLPPFRVDCPTHFRLASLVQDRGPNGFIPVVVGHVTAIYNPHTSS